jgi:predicted NBD/HSP70 family sugar kinase
MPPPRSQTTTDALRRGNQSAVLSIVHRAGRVSRAELAKATGLTRATVGVVLADLVELGLVYVVRPTEADGVGRPSHLVYPEPATVAVAVNPEVDAVHVGIVELGGRVRAAERIGVSSVPSVAQVVELAAAASQRMLAAAPARVAGVGVAVPGQVRDADGQVREATHFGWREEPLAALLESATGHRTFAANAARVAMQAEITFGAGRGIDDLLYAIGGASGIGGGAVVAGRVLGGSGGYAGEVGHIRVRDPGTPCHCGSRGCLEAEVTQERLLAAVGLPADGAHLLADALAASTDPAVHELVADGTRLLGVALRAAVNLLDPAVVVLSGFLDALVRTQPLADFPDHAIRSVRADLEVRPTALGADQLLVGAAELVWARLLADPVRFLAAAV